MASLINFFRYYNHYRSERATFARNADGIGTLQTVTEYLWLFCRKGYVTFLLPRADLVRFVLWHYLLLLLRARAAASTPAEEPDHDSCIPVTELPFYLRSSPQQLTRNLRWRREDVPQKKYRFVGFKKKIEKTKLFSYAWSILGKASTLHFRFLSIYFNFLNFQNLNLNFYFEFSIEILYLNVQFKF